MPRFFFHLHNDVDASDEEGVELPDLASAREHARCEAVHMAAASISEHQRLFGEHRIDVEDQAGEVLISVSFREVVDIKPWVSNEREHDRWSAVKGAANAALREARDPGRILEIESWWHPAS